MEDDAPLGGITHHVFVVVAVVVGLSCVRVAVFDEVLHGAAERARHWGQTGHIKLISNQLFHLLAAVWVSDLEVKRCSYRLWGRRRAGAPACRRSRADCTGAGRPGCTGSPRRILTAPSARGPERRQPHSHIFDNPDAPKLQVKLWGYIWPIPQEKPEEAV